MATASQSSYTSCYLHLTPARWYYYTITPPHSTVTAILLFCINHRLGNDLPKAILVRSKEQGNITTKKWVSLSLHLVLFHFRKLFLYTNIINFYFSRFFQSKCILLLRNGKYLRFNKSVMQIFYLNLSASLMLLCLSGFVLGQKAYQLTLSLSPCPPSLDLCHLDIVLKNKISERSFNFWKEHREYPLLFVTFQFSIWKWHNNLCSLFTRNRDQKNNLGLIKHKVPQALILALFQFSDPCLWFI